MSAKAMPDTAVSPTLDTITVSTMPTSMTSTCSITKGINIFLSPCSKTTHPYASDFAFAFQ